MHSSNELRGSVLPLTKLISASYPNSHVRCRMFFISNIPGTQKEDFEAIAF